MSTLRPDPEPAPAAHIFGHVRVQPLGPGLVRIEQRGPRGFEDRPTFTVAERRRVGAAPVLHRAAGEVCISTSRYRVSLPENAEQLADVRVEALPGGAACVLHPALLAPKPLPAPSALPAIWVLGDRPRVVPPDRGALPPPAGDEDPTSGWDLANDAPDAYVFFPAAVGYAAFRAEFLRLTGHIPLVPLFALGLWYSRYFAYSEETALAVIRKFRAKRIPLDVFVADTDWRVGASSGYAVNETFFPDMARFVRRAHELGVRVMLNDHPEPAGRGALDPEELRYRQRGLTSLLALGVDLWWFDRNWHTHLQAPAPGLEKEVWGMRLYHDITRAFRPDRRPLIMANADGINNGRRDAPSHPAAHRFPVWWTGDTVGEWLYLQLGVRNGVDSGIEALLSYVHEDLGGHHGQPAAELYVRFMQYGALSPVARIHCSATVHRYPWEYGAEVERIVAAYFQLRYRLLPMLYAAALAAHRSGTPLLRRCDLEWPEHPEAADSTQYLLGDDLLVAPILGPAPDGQTAERSVWIPPGAWQDLWTGRIRAGPATVGVRCGLGEYPVFVRRGGMVFTAPLRESTGSAWWPELIVDAFVPPAEGPATRLLYEDDGMSTAQARGVSRLTAFTLERRRNRLHIAWEPVVQAAGVPGGTRTTILRIHLPPGGSPKIKAAGAPASSGAEWSVLLADGKRPYTLWVGPGVAPPPEAGPVVEMRLQADVSASGGVDVEWD